MEPVDEAQETPALSVVTTLYRSQRYIDEFYNRMKATLAKAGLAHEIIFVNDGSPDESLDYARRLADADQAVVVVDLSRNFGHHKAMMTGLEFARHPLVFLIDVDLEEAPELLLEYLAALRSDASVDVIYGVQDQRKGGWFERVSGRIFYALFNRLSEDQLPPNMALSRLMTRRYVRNLLRFRERNLFIPGVWHMMGFEQRPLTIQKTSSGETSYTLRKKLTHFVDAVTSFSDTPLTLIFYSGLVLCGVSFALAAFFIVLKLIYGVSVSGWTSLIVVFSSFTGIVILFLGVIGIYLSKLFIEIKQRPYTIIKSVHPAGRGGARWRTLLRVRPSAGRGMAKTTPGDDPRA